MNKKGSLRDLGFIMIILLGSSLIFLIGFKVQDTFNTSMQSMSDDVIVPDAKAASTTLVNLYPGAIDNTYLFFAIGLAVITLVLAALVRFSPLFIPFYIIGLVFVVIVSGIVSNIYQMVAANATLASYANQLTNMSNVLTFLPWIIGIFGTILMIVSYNKYKEDNL